MNTIENTISESTQIRHGDAANDILEWASNSGWDVAIWTARESNYAETTDQKAFPVNSAIGFFSSLTGHVRMRAFEYINNAPAEVGTPLRRMFTSVFNQSI